MKTYRYSKEFPDGKVFDTTGQTAPLPPSELNGWFDTPAKLHITQDQLIDALVRKELATQTRDRGQLEREYKEKTGRRPHSLAKDETLMKVIDGK